MNDNECSFETRELFREWLSLHGETSNGIWLIFSKTNNLKTLSAHEALEEALCYGWIDGQLVSIDKERYKKYFARRRTKSNWSDKNKILAKRLIEKGVMAQQGLDAIASAKQSGEWNNSKQNIASEEQLLIFKQLIEPHQTAYTNLLAMSDSIQRTYTLFYFDAKSEKKRLSRLEKIIDRLNNKLKPM